MILLAHGLEGSPQGRKAQALRAAGLSLLAPDQRGKVLAERIAELEALSAHQSPMLLVGSSYGGLAAAWLAEAHPSRWRGILLLAPALHYEEPPALGERTAPAGLPVVILHGIHDEVVPIEASRAYARRSPGVLLHELEDDHRLEAHLDRIVAEVQALLLR